MIRSASLAAVLHRQLAEFISTFTFKAETLDVIIDLLEQLQPARFPKDERKPLEALKQLHALVEREAIHVVFFGVFKAGKSTLLNAMLGTNLLPTGVNRVTGVITQFRTASAAAARVFYNDHRGEQEIPFDEVARFIRLDTKGGASIAPESVDHVEIEFPHESFSPRGVYIDTPGLRDTPELSERVMQELESADLAIMLVDATKVFGEDEQRAAKHVNQSLRGNLVFVITKLEIADDELNVVDWVRTSLEQEHFGNDLVGYTCVFPVHSQRALQSRLQNQPGEAVEKLEQFERWLYQLLTHHRDRLAINARLGVIAQAAANARTYYGERHREIALQLQRAEQSWAQTNQQHQEAALSRTKPIIAELRYLRSTLDQRAATFKTNLVNNMVGRVATDPKWHEHLGVPISDTLNEYSNRVNSDVQAAVGGALKTIPPFRPQITIGSTNIQPDRAGKWGMYIGGTVGIAFGLIGVGVGATVGNWLGKKLFGRDVQSEVLTRATEMANTMAASLHQATDDYISEIYGVVSGTATTDALPPSPALISLREQAQLYQNMLAVIDKLIQYAARS